MLRQHFRTAVDSCGPSLGFCSLLGAILKFFLFIIFRSDFVAQSKLSKKDRNVIIYSCTVIKVYIYGNDGNVFLVLFPLAILLVQSPLPDLGPEANKPIWLKSWPS